jgi:hypothetical protein
MHELIGKVIKLTGQQLFDTFTKLYCNSYFQFIG